MRMDSGALKFDPQVMALAMPGESGFSKAAEGIGNIGKLFDAQEDRAQQQQLNALKMDEAKLSIDGKRFENSIQGVKWENEKTNHLIDRRNKTLDGLKKQMEVDADIKKAQDSGFMDQFKKLLPSTAFNDPKTGKFSEELYAAKRGEFVGSNDWATKNIHLFDALADGYRKESIATLKDKAGIEKDQATTYKTLEEGKTVAPKAAAEIEQKKSSAVKNYAGANLDNVNAAQAPIKTAAYVEQTQTSSKNADNKAKDLTKERQKIVADGKLGELVQNYDVYDEKGKQFIINKYIQDGTLPISMKTTVKKGVFSDDEHYVPLYPAGTLPKSTPAKRVTDPIKSKQSYDYTKYLK